MKEIKGYSLQELEGLFQEMHEKKFRAEQVFTWLYQKGAASFQEMTNMSVDLRRKLEGTFTFHSVQEIKRQISEDGETLKYLFELKDQKRIESVLILAPSRRTVCVSSQVGCPARCAFCASGKEGLFRNLSAAEIVDQVVFIDRILKEKGERVSHVVFMGMGEPLENYEAVTKAIEILISEKGLNLSQRRITVSTVGVVEGIKKLSQENRFRVNLVLSLHAPNDHIRKKIIPYARRYPLEEVLLSMDEYAKATGRDITYEYTLIHGINDSLESAQLLRDLLRNKQCTVNLIPYNPVEGLKLSRPSKERIEAFRDILEQGKITTTWRYTKGKDIAAACGQLAVQKA